MGPSPGAISVIPVAALDPSNFSVELKGEDHGDPGVSLILVDASPGSGPSLHTHEYAEVILVLQGTATFTDGVSLREVGGGHVVVIPAGTPHAFTNTGDTPLKQVDIHVADTFATSWLCSPG